MWKRLRTSPRRPFFWLTLVCVGVWFLLLQANLHPLATTIVNMAPVDEDGRPVPPNNLLVSRSVAAVSDDGRDVILQTYFPISGGMGQGAECWNMHTGRATIPRANLDPMRLRMQYPDWRWGSAGGYERLVHDPEGWTFLFDEPAWIDLKKRFTAAEEQFWAGRPDAKTRRPNEESFLPRSIWFSPEGHYLTYSTLCNLPDYDDDDRVNRTGTMLEANRTGKRLAFFPDVSEVLAVSRDGRYALTPIPATNSHKRHWRICIDDRDDLNADIPRMHLWDVSTGTIRAALATPDNTLAPQFAADGAYVLEHWCTTAEKHHWRWWDTATGQQRGEAQGGREFLLLDGGRTLLTTPEVVRTDENEPVQMHFWDLATGTRVATWDFGRRNDYGGVLHNFKAAPDGSTFVAQFSRNRQPDTFTLRALDRVLEPFTPADTDDQAWFIMFDRKRGDEVARFRGRAAVYSANSHWLATSDGDLLRVWELPARKPWRAILGVALLAGIVSATVLWYLHRWGALPSAWFLWLGRRLWWGKRFACERG